MGRKPLQGGKGMADTVVLPKYFGDLTKERRLALIDDMRCDIMLDMKEASAEAVAIVNCAPQDMDALNEANYLHHLLTCLLLVLVQEEANAGRS